MAVLLALVGVISHFILPAEGPVGLSDVTSVAGEIYYAVDDRGGRLYELTVSLDGTGAVSGFATSRCIVLAGRVDLEGCAWDPLEKRIWVSDESDSSVRQFDPVSGRETAAAPVPEVYRRESVPNRSLEALAISPDGLKMYFANEDTLRCDGAVATTNRGGIVRIQELVRQGAGRPWIPARSFRYRTHRLRGLPWEGRSVSGVAALSVDSDGSLLVLERAFGKGKGAPIPTFRARLVRLTVEGVADEGSPARQTLWDGTTGLANCEGLARGPVLSDGRRTWLIVSDAGGGAEAGILVLGECADSLPSRKAVAGRNKESGKS